MSEVEFKVNGLYDGKFQDRRAFRLVMRKQLSLFRDGHHWKQLVFYWDSGRDVRRVKPHSSEAELSEDPNSFGGRRPEAKGFPILCGTSLRNARLKESQSPDP